MLKLLMGKALPWVGGGLLLALIAASLTAAYQMHRVGELEGEIHTARTELQRAQDALRDTNAANDGLRAAVDQWRALATPAADVKAAAEEATAAARRIEDRAGELARQEEPDLALPDCAALLRVDLAAVCPAIARGMRERAARGLPRPDDRGAGRGGREDGPAPDR